MGRHPNPLRPGKTEGHRLLALYLHLLNRSLFARRVGCTRQYVTILVNGENVPGVGLAFRIESVTCGRIPAQAWTVPAGTT